MSHFGATVKWYLGHTLISVPPKKEVQWNVKHIQAESRCPGKQSSNTIYCLFMACVNMACFMRDWTETGQQISGLHCCQNSFALLDLSKIFNTFAEMKLHKMRSEDPAAYSSPLQLTLSPCSSPSSVITLFTCCCPQSLSDPFPRPVQITNLGEKWCRNKMRFFLLGKWS